MSTPQTASITVTNKTNGHYFVRLYHYNLNIGVESMSWEMQASQTSTPFTVHFNTGVGSFGVPDYWWLSIFPAGTQGGPAYATQGDPSTPITWLENQLQSADAGKQIHVGFDTLNVTLNLPSGAASAPLQNLGGNTPAQYPNPITNIFVLMLENHSFDNIFAMSGIPGIRVATTKNSNKAGKTTYNVRGNAPAGMPTDPGHEFQDVVEQLAGSGAKYVKGKPYPAINNSGFAANYATSTTEGPAPHSADIGDIMACFKYADSVARYLSAGHPVRHMRQLVLLPARPDLAQPVLCPRRIFCRPRPEPDLGRIGRFRVAGRLHVPQGVDI